VAGRLLLGGRRRGLRHGDEAHGDALAGAVRVVALLTLQVHGQHQQRAVGHERVLALGEPEYFLRARRLEAGAVRGHVADGEQGLPGRLQQSQLQVLVRDPRMVKHDVVLRVAPDLHGPALAAPELEVLGGAALEDDREGHDCGASRW